MPSQYRLKHTMKKGGYPVWSEILQVLPRFENMGMIGVILEGLLNQVK